DRCRRQAGGQAHGWRRRAVDTIDDWAHGTRGYRGRASASARGADDGRLRGQRQALRRHAQGPEGQGASRAAGDRRSQASLQGRGTRRGQEGRRGDPSQGDHSGAKEGLSAPQRRTVARARSAHATLAWRLVLQSLRKRTNREAGGAILTARNRGRSAAGVRLNRRSFGSYFDAIGADRNRALLSFWNRRESH